MPFFHTSFIFYNVNYFCWLYLCHRSPEEMGSKNETAWGSQPRVGGLRRTLPQENICLEKGCLRILAAVKDIPEYLSQLKGQESFLKEVRDTERLQPSVRGMMWFWGICKQLWGARLTPNPEPPARNPEWLLAVLCCLQEQHLAVPAPAGPYQVGHNDGVDDDRAGWGAQGELQSPRWLPSGNVIAVPLQQQVLQLILCSHNTVHLKGADTSSEVPAFSHSLTL